MAIYLLRLSCLCFLLNLATESVLAQRLVKVFVETEADGFTAAGVGDSALDLTRSLGGKKKMQVVDAPAKADFTVRITSRDERKQFAGAVTTHNESKNGKTSTAVTTPTEKTVYTVHAILSAANFETDLSGEGLIWRAAAGELAGKIDRWVKQNHDRLTERKPEDRDSARFDQSHSPASAASPTPSAKIINPGMSPEEVIKAIGEPLKKVAFGPKALWTYKGLQVVFEDSKVTDVKF